MYMHSPKSGLKLCIWDSHSFMRNSFIRNLYWDGTQAREVKKLIINFLSFCYHNFGNTVTSSEKDIFREKFLTDKQNFKRSIFVIFAIHLYIPRYKPLQSSENQIYKNRYLFSTVKPCFFLSVVLYFTLLSSELCTPTILNINACCLTLAISYFVLLSRPSFVPFLFEVH